MKNTKDNRAEVPAEPEVPTVEVSVKATVDHLEISDCAVARIQEVYDRFLSGCTDEYHTGWPNAQMATDEGYLSLQEIMQQMQANTEDDEYHDLDDCRGCDHCRRIVNIYNANGGVINIMI